MELIDAPEVEARCEASLAALVYECVSGGIELKIDAREGVSKLIEINPGYGLWEDIGMPVGTDLAHEHRSPARSPRR